MIKKISLSILSIVIFTELGLQVLSFTYSHFHNPHPQSKVLGVTDNKNGSRYKFMFIGDSWTVGADAPPQKGYPDLLHELLTKNKIGNDISFINLAKSSNNSSEAIIEFSRGYQQFKPNFLVALLGMNNGWNTYDIEIANNELNTNLGIFDSNDDSSSSTIANLIKKTRIFRFYYLAKFNLIDSKINLKYGHPETKFDEEYFKLYGEGKEDEALDYLTNNYQLAHTYDDFFRYVLYHFSYNLDETIRYLSEKQIYFPEKITSEFNQGKHNELISNVPTLLNDQLSSLKKISQKNGITLILQTYPCLENDIWKTELNKSIRIIAKDQNIHLVDHEMLFRDKYNSDDWNRILTPYHVNEEGYLQMAKNIYEYLMNNNLL
ncbi:MAG: hypothetical protein GW942_00555 [Candidatus Pacebacteria bacterium]|nr:hypothetical protein [Candidatus Paceibacterota bacterium]